jgi:glucose-1-phosphate thymidylyltransferase
MPIEPLSKTRGIILAGGRGTRLTPLTLAFSKQLLPIFDKPLIYYPLAILMMTGIRDILIITTPADRALFERLLGDGSRWGISLQFCEQPAPNGLAEAFILGEQFLAGGPSCLVLGDNIFYGHGLPATLMAAANNNRGATIFGYQVRDPERYGVVEFGPDRRVVSIEEKPRVPKSNYAVPGIYFYDSRAPEFARAMKPSARGELEITDLNMCYLAEGSLTVELLGRGVAWLDTGTPASLAQASSFIETIELRQGLKVCCPEEIAHANHWIDDAALLRVADQLGDCSYADYLRELVAHRHGGR